MGARTFTRFVIFGGLTTTPDHDLYKIQKLPALILAELNRVCRHIGTSYAIYGDTVVGAIRHGSLIPWDDDINVIMTRADCEHFLTETPIPLDDRFRLDNTCTRDDFLFMLTKIVMPGILLIPKTDKDSKHQMPFFLDVLPLDEIPDDSKAFQKMSRQSWLWGRLLFLQGTPHPHPISAPAWKKTLIFPATTLAHLDPKTVCATPTSLWTRWERAIRRCRGTSMGVYVDFAMCNPQNQIMREEEFFPTRDVPFEDVTVMAQNGYGALLRRGYGGYMQLPPPEKRYNHEAAIIDFGLCASNL